MINLTVSLLPWWDSLDAVRRTHSDLEAASIAGFALLVAFDSIAHVLEKSRPDRSRTIAGIGLIFFWLAVTAEIAAYEYGQRNDELSGNQIRSLDRLVSEAKSKAGDAKTLAGNAVTDATNAVKVAALAQTKAGTANASSEVALNRASSALQEAEEVKEKLADRKLSPLQMTAMGWELGPFNGQEYTVTAYWNSPESIDFANQIHQELHDIARWKYNPEGSKSQMLGGMVGVFVWTHPNADEKTLSAAKVLVEALRADGFKAEEKKQNPVNPKTNIINVNVGSKN